MAGSESKLILMIDNYDSFTYNLVHYLGELGQRIEVRRNDCLDFGFVDDLDPDMIVISPGALHAQGCGAFGRRNKKVRRGKAHSRRLPGSPGGGLRVRGEHSPGREASSRKNLPYHSRRKNPLQGSSESLRGHEIPFASGGGSVSSVRLRDFRPDRGG